MLFITEVYIPDENSCNTIMLNLFFTSSNRDVLKIFTVFLLKIYFNGQNSYLKSFLVYRHLLHMLIEAKPSSAFIPQHLTFKLFPIAPTAVVNILICM